MNDSIANPLERWSREQLWILGAAVTVGVVFGWLGRQALITTGGDDATYILLAQSLAHGQYRDIFLSGTPAHAQYPPLFPLLILAVRTIALGSLEAVRVANLLLLALTALLTAEVTRRIAGNTVGVASAALVMLNPLLLFHTGWIGSDIFLVSWTTLTLWASHRARTRSSKTFWVMAGCAALAAFFTRSAGIAVVLAVVGSLLMQRRWKVAPVVGAIVVASVAAWFVYTRRAASHTLGWSYQRDLAYVHPSMPLEVLHRILVNAREYGRIVGSAVYGIPDIPGMPIDNVVWFVFLVGIAVLGLWRLLRSWPTAVLYAALMTGVLLVYPFVAQRLLVPLVPVLIVALLYGVGQIARRLGAVHPDRAVVVIAVALAGVGIVSGAEAAMHGMACRAAEGGACRSEAEQAWVAAAEWSKTGLPANAVVASSKPSTFYLISGRQGIPSRMLFTRRLDDVLVPKGPVTHILLSDLWDYERGSLNHALQAICLRLRPVLHADNRALIVAVLPGDSVSQDGCRALQEFQNPVVTRR
jgi:hypothetical protein